MISYILYPLLFFPSITFGLLPAEIFPWAFIVSLYHYPIIKNKIIILPILFVPSLLLAVNDGVDIIGISRSLFSFLNSLLIFFVIIKLNYHRFNLIIKILKYSIFLTIFISIIQFIYSDINRYLLYLVPRLEIYLSGILQAQGKGFSGLSTEPSRQAIELVILFSTVIAISKYTKLRVIFLEVILLLYLLFINSSATGVAFYLIYLLKYFFNFKIFLAFILIIIFTLFIYLFPWQSLNIRGVNVISDIITTGISSDTIFDLLFDKSGFRFSTVIAVYSNPTLLGYGLGNWGFGMIESLSMSPYLYEFNEYFDWACGGEPCAIRASSFVSAMVLEAGVIVTLIILFILIKEKNKVSKEEIIFHQFTRPNLSSFIPVIFSLLLIGDTGNPIPFIALAILTRIFMNNNK